jgi:hypothetical protein
MTKEINENNVRRGATISTLFLLAKTNVLAQEEENEHEDATESTEGSGKENKLIEEEELEMPIDSFQINFRRYKDEFISLFILLIIIALVDHFSSKRNRRGCIIFTALFFVLIYIMTRCLF